VKRVTKIRGVRRRLLDFLNQKQGFFKHGNQIRFTVHMESSESALLFLLEDQPSKTINKIIKGEFQGLVHSIEYNADNQKFWLNPNRLLIDLASSNRFYSDDDANRDGLPFVESKNKQYPFVVILDAETVNYTGRMIPVEYINENTLKIGAGSEFLISHNYIPDTTIEILRKMPTIVRW
jgi:hypothetical protein